MGSLFSFSILSAGNSVVSIMMRLCLLALVVFSALTDPSEGSTIRVERDACADLNEAFHECTQKAYTEYSEAITAGDDGRPDWYARKACNYVTAAVEDCGNKLIGECMTEEQVNTEKDRQIVSVLQGLSSNEEWDSEKCPPVKAHLVRTNPVENEEDGDSDSTTDESKSEESNAEVSKTELTDTQESKPEVSNTDETKPEESNAEVSKTEVTDTQESKPEDSNSGESNTENTDTESGSAIATASLSLVLVLYLVCCA